MKNLLSICVLFVLSGLCNAAQAGKGEGDTLRLNADEAVRYARWIHFMRFGDTWSVSRDTSGNAWVVKAEKVVKVKKAFRDHNGSVYQCGEAENCRMRIQRYVILDEKTARIIKRNQHRSFERN